MKQHSTTLTLKVNYTFDHSRTDADSALATARGKVVLDALSHRHTVENGVRILSVVDESGTIELAEAYRKIKNDYAASLLSLIKGQIRALCPDTAHQIDIADPVEEDYFDRIGKYDTPRDYPANYILLAFGIQNGRLYVTGRDVDDRDREDTFSEYDLTVEELEQIHFLLLDLKDYIDEGYFLVRPDGTVMVRRLRHIGSFPMGLSSVPLSGMTTDEIGSAVATAALGDFVPSSDGDETTPYELEREGRFLNKSTDRRFVVTENTDSPASTHVYEFIDED